MEEFYKALCDILSFAAGEPVVLKPLSQISAEIAALAGQSDWGWIPYFLSPENIMSIFIQGAPIYALVFILMYLPWRLLRSMFPGGRRKKGD